MKKITTVWMVLALAVSTVSAASLKTRYTEVELIAEQASLPEAGGTITVGLYLKPDPGWHVYWVNPGDAGKGATVKWQLPEAWTHHPAEKDYHPDQTDVANRHLAYRAR